MNIITRALHMADAAVALAKVSTTRADDIKLYDEALTVIRKARAEQDHIAASGKVIAEPVKQEPVGYVSQSVIDWLSSNERTEGAYSSINLYKNPCGSSDAPLYAAPVRTKDLTDCEIEAIDDANWENDHKTWDIKKFARSVIAADRALNNPSSDLL